MHKKAHNTLYISYIVYIIRYRFYAIRIVVIHCNVHSASSQGERLRRVGALPSEILSAVFPQATCERRRRLALKEGERTLTCACPCPV